MPLSKTVKIDGYKASKPYSVTVTAVDSYGNESKPLTKIYVETPDEDERNAARVTGLIDAIGTVTEESGGAITNARAAYEALSYDAKKLVNNHGVLLSAINDYDKLFITFEQYFNIARTGRTVVGQNYWAGTGEMQYSNTEKGIMINYSHAMPNVRMGLKRFDLDGLHLKFDSLEKSPEMGAKYYPAIGILLGGTEHPIYTEPQKTSILLFLDTSTGRLEGHPGFKQIISDPALRYENLKNREWDIKFEKAESGDFVIEIAGKKGLIDKSFFDGSFTLTDTTKTYLSISCWIDDGSFSLRLMSAHDASSTCYGDDKVSFKQIEEIKQLDKEIGEIGKVTADSKAAIESAEARYNAVPERYKFMVTGANLLKEAREEYDRLSAVGSDGQASSAKSGGCKGGISGAESAMLIIMILSAVSVTSLKKLKRR
ncbi:MAG: hypothetical protein IJU84_04470, partial [Clostridia bacterium]|nr:hypothetical protein [Clostridia bacterium]